MCRLEVEATFLHHSNFCVKRRIDELRLLRQSYLPSLLFLSRPADCAMLLGGTPVAQYTHNVPTHVDSMYLITSKRLILELLVCCMLLSHFLFPDPYAPLKTVRNW
jgi:hypothetical protein